METTVVTKKNNINKDLKQASYVSSVDLIRKIFLDRKEKNINYSLNAYARDLGLSASLLSRILSGSRALSLKQGMHIAAVLNFNQTETNYFILSIIEKSKDKAKISKKIKDQIKLKLSKAESQLNLDAASPVYVNYEVERFKLIAQWYHLAILNLTYIKNFINEPSFIAERLGISTIEAKEAVDRLLDLGLLEENEDGILSKTKEHLYFKTNKSEAAVRAYHSKMIEKAQNELNKNSADDFKRRLINSITFSCGDEHIELLKKKIDEFQDEVLAQVKLGSKTEVYQFNFQLFPLTKKQIK